MEYAIVIPARYQSSRFPGKPLVDILGKPMIQHVWERCCLAVDHSKVYVATDDSKISSVVESFGGKVVMTSSTCLTGTDRLAEANLELDCDFLVNVQGDEPLVNPDDIKKVVAKYLESPDTVVNAMAPISDEQDFRSKSVPKVVASASNRLLYMSRASVPTDKEHRFKGAKKQVCIYAFSRNHLSFFASHREKTELEAIEDIEILRFLENDIPVEMVEVSESSVAVDFPSDVNRVIEYLEGDIAE